MNPTIRRLHEAKPYAPPKLILDMPITRSEIEGVVKYCEGFLMRKDPKFLNEKKEIREALYRGRFVFLGFRLIVVD